MSSLTKDSVLSSKNKASKYDINSKNVSFTSSKNPISYQKKR